MHKRHAAAPVNADTTLLFWSFLRNCRYDYVILGAAPLFLKILIFFFQKMKAGSKWIMNMQKSRISIFLQIQPCNTGAAYKLEKILRGS